MRNLLDIFSVKKLTFNINHLMYFIYIKQQILSWITSAHPSLFIQSHENILLYEYSE